MKLFTDVPLGSLKGLLTHFDYSGPVVTENITSIRTIKLEALFFFSLSLVVAPFTPPDPPSALFVPDSKQSTNYSLRHLKE